MSFKGFVEGAIAAVVAGCDTHSSDLIKVECRLKGKPYQTSNSHAKGEAKKPMAVRGGVLGAGLQIAQKGEPMDFFAGISASALRHALCSTARLRLFDRLKQQWADDDGRLPMSEKIHAVPIAGGIGAAGGNSVDLTMVRMEPDRHLPFQERGDYASAGDAIFQKSGQEGIGSLWRGALPSMQRAMVVTAAQLAIDDKMKEGCWQHKSCKLGLRRVLHRPFWPVW